jgi:hypothetical protein
MLNRNHLSAACAVAFLAGSAQAVVVTYNNRAAWNAAIGGPAFMQNFAPFAADTSFQAAAVNIGGGMQLRQVGPGAARNEIDVPALVFADNNGTQNASCYVNAPDPGIGPTMVYVDFLTIVCAWGADFWGANSGEGLTVEVLSPAGAVLTTMNATGVAGEFMGFTCAPGEVRWVRYRSRTAIAGGTGEGFGSDNYSLKYSCPVLVACYANCDHSTVTPVLNVNDFQCFMNAYAAGESYANCDQSTIPPVLNVNDFNCFLNKYGAGCP